ncbi:hypothetical protein B0G57_10872 [Trinickia symbiotica]|nr:hypothetical protein B0G57_10872 [Trinickia symbiotica]
MTFGPRPAAQVKAAGPSPDPSIEWWVLNRSMRWRI